MLFKFPIYYDVEDKKKYEKKVLEFIPNIIRKGEAIIVRVPKYLGFSEKTFVRPCINTTGK